MEWSRLDWIRLDHSIISHIKGDAIPLRFHKANSSSSISSSSSDVSYYVYNEWSDTEYDNYIGDI